VGRRIAVLAALVAAVLWGAWLRVDGCLRDPGFDVEEPAGMLRSDPALLYHLTRSIRDAGGIPARFRADPDLQHPDLTDVPAEFTVGQEFLVAAVARLMPDTPLVITAVRVMALVATLVLVGVFVFVQATTRSSAVALFAVFLALSTPAAYRTIGFVLVREDLALPLWVLHLGLLARALRHDRLSAHLASGLALAAALATWHAMGFVVALELAVLLAGRLWTGTRPSPASAGLLVAPALAALLVPALRTAGLVASPAAALAVGHLAPLVWRRARTAGARRVTTLVAAGAWFVLTRPLAPAAYDHVRDVLLAKLRFLGRLPGDPNAMSFDARLLWQGPFETLALGDLAAWVGWGGLVLAVVGAGVLTTLGRAPDRRRSLEGFAMGLLVVALPAAWAFARLTILLGALVPLVAALALARLWEAPASRFRTVALSAFALLGLTQLASFRTFVAEHRVVWYLPPDARHELTRTLAAVRREVPEGAAVACDFVNSTAVLALAGRPIALQPKYETEASRRKAEVFLTTLFHGSTEEFLAVVRERLDCRYLLLDRHVLWDLSRYTAGLPLASTGPLPGTAAEVLLAPQAADGVPGLELLYATAQPARRADFRLYRVP
jgi:hypothetical protein